MFAARFIPEGEPLPPGVPELPVTGADVTRIIAAGGLSLLVGVGAIILSRPRPSYAGLHRRSIL